MRRIGCRRFGDELGLQTRMAPAAAALHGVVTGKGDCQSSASQNVISQSAREFLGRMHVESCCRSPIVRLTFGRSVGHSEMACGLLGSADSRRRRNVRENSAINLCEALK